MSIVQAGSWQVGTTAAISFDATPSAGQLLVLSVRVMNNVVSPSMPATPSGWSLRTNKSGANGTLFEAIAWFDRVANGTATDTPTLTGQSGTMRWTTGRFTGHDAASPYDGSGAVSSSGTGGAQTINCGPFTPTRNGTAFAALAVSNASQTVTSWNNGFVQSWSELPLADGGAIATAATTSGTASTASVTVNNGGSFPAAMFVSAYYKNAVTIRKANVNGVATTETARYVNVGGTATAANRRVNVNGVAT